MYRHFQLRKIEMLQRETIFYHGKSEEIHNQGVSKQADKSKVLKHIKIMHFLGCQFDQSDHKCWLFDNLY